jgi:hypothetical protein
MVTTSDPVILPPIPCNSLEIRSKIRMGRQLFFNILPHPMVRKMDDPSDEHVYVLPSDCILHFLAQGIVPLEFNKLHIKYPITYLNKTPRGIEIGKSLEKIKIGKVFLQRHSTYYSWNGKTIANRPNQTKCQNSRFGSLLLLFSGKAIIGTHPSVLIQLLLVPKANPMSQLKRS